MTWPTALEICNGPPCSFNNTDLTFPYSILDQVKESVLVCSPIRQIITQKSYIQWEFVNTTCTPPNICCLQLLMIHIVRLFFCLQPQDHRRTKQNRTWPTNYLNKRLIANPHQSPHRLNKLEQFTDCYVMTITTNSADATTATTLVNSTLVFT